MNLFDILIILEYLRPKKEQEEAPLLLTWTPSEEMQDA